MANTEKNRRKDGVLVTDEPSASAAQESVQDQAPSTEKSDDVEWRMEQMEFTEGVSTDAGISQAVEAIDATNGDETGVVGTELSDADAVLADQELGPSEFFEADRVKSIVESLLFISDRPISMATMKQIFAGSNVRSKDIARAIDALASDLAHPARGVVLEEITTGFQLRTKVDNSEFLRRLNKSRPFRLSGPALETLSIIAYKQPITKHEVDEIRGVESGHLIRALMERAMVSFAGKAENLPGKPMQYGTTKRFLETFGLRNLRELPTLAEIDDLLPEGIGDEVEEKKPVLADLTEGMSEIIRGTYSEGEEELAKITDQISTIDTSSDFFEQEKIRQREKRDQERAANIREALAVGEAVEDKDVKWLKRYDDKLALAARAALNPTPVSVEGQILAGVAAVAVVGTEDGAEFRRDIEGLSQQYGAQEGHDDADTSGEDALDEGRNEEGFLNDSDWEDLNDDDGKGDAARDDDPAEY